MGTRFFERPDGSIAYDDTRGDGPLVVAAPGMGDTRSVYRFLAPRLVREGVRFVSMDLRGHGESSVGWSEYTPEVIGDDIVALLRHLDAGPAYIIGNSISAASAVWAAAEAPRTVRGIILVGPFVRDPRINPIMRLLMLAVISRPWGPWAWSKFYSKLYPSSPPTDLAEHQKDLQVNLSEPGRLQAFQEMARASKARAEARIGEVEAPTLVVMGTKDSDFPDPAGEAEYVAEQLSGSVELIDGAGHYPHAEFPDVFVERVLPFLQKVADGVA